MDNIPCRVLLVEDNEDDYLIVRDLLSDVATTQFDLQWVNTYDAARKSLADDQYDVCLLDYGLSEATGVELVREFKGKGKPLILLTGNEDFEVDVAAAKAGAADYLIKGHINALLLERAIRYAIERARAESSVLASEIRYRRLFESAYDGILILDAVTRKITDVNPYLQEMLEYSRDEFIGKELWELGLLRDAEAFRMLLADGYIRYDDLPLESKSGKRYDVEFVSNVYGEDSRQVVQCNIRDITERKRAQEAEQESQRFLQSTLNALSSHIAVLDETGRIIAVNRAWWQFAEDNNGAISSTIGSNYLQVCEQASGVWADEAPAVAEGIRAVIASPDASFCIEYPCHSPTEERWFNVCLTRFAGEGPVRVVVAHENITERKKAEVSLQENETKFRTIFDTTLDAILLANDDGIYVDANPAACALLGTSYEQLMGHSVLDFVTPSTRDTVHAAWAELPGEKQQSGEFELRRPDGTERLAEYRAVSEMFPGVHMAVMRDITERKQAENHLRQSEANLAKSQQMAHLGSWELDLSNLEDINANALRWSDELYRIFGYEPGQIEATNEVFFRAVHPDDAPTLSRMMAEAVQGGRSYSVEHRIILPDGRERIVYAQSEIVYNEETGLPVRMIGLGQDITERKQAEEALRHSEARLAAIFTEAAVGLSEIGLDGRFLRVNNELCRIIGRSHEELLKLAVLEVTHPDHVKESTLALQQALSTHQSASLDRRYLRSDGTAVWANSTVTPLLDGHGQVHKFLAVTVDITERKQAENALMESEERFRQMSESVDEVFWLFDPVQEKLLYVSPSFERLWGFSSQSFLDQTVKFIDTVHPEDRQRILAALTYQGQPNGYSEEHRIVRPDGEVRWVWGRTFPIYDNTGNVYRIAGIAQDISARKEAEAALYEANNVLELRVEERTAELQQANAETRARARQQEAVAELGQRALTNVDMDILVTDATALVTATLGVEISSVLELLPGGDTLRIRAGSGWKTDVIGSVVPGDANSKDGYALLSKLPVVVTDLALETRFPPSPLLQGEGVVSSITVVVGSHKQPFGTIGAYTRQQRNFSQDDIHFLQAMANVLAAALEQRHAEEALHRAKEEAERANIAKSEFLSRMSHELRTPLNAILGFGQILEMRNVDASPQQQDNIQQILRAGYHLLDLINEVLDIARIEAGHLSLSLEPIAAGQMVQEVLDVMRPLAADKHIHLTNDIRAESGESYVLADQQRLKQVLINLLSNAIKYNRDGGHAIVSCTIVKGEQNLYDGISCIGRLCLLVRDTGPGLSAQNIADLFVPFERLGAAQTRIQGTGIGLALSKRLVEAMNGQIGVESELGQGSTFWVELPLIKDVMSTIGASETTLTLPLSPPNSEKPLTIVYIEDNLSNIKLIESLLSDLSPSIRLLPALQGSLGLALAAQHLPDLILLDVQLRDIMGDVVLSHLKSNPVTKHIPVVVLSADATTRQIERLLNAGASHYLTKPLVVDQFFSVLKETLQDTNSRDN